MVEQENWIFYLIWSNELPSHYHNLAQKFNQHNLTLIPVRNKELVDLFQNFNQVSLIIVTSNLDDLKIFNSYYKRLLEMGIKNNKLVMFHLSSFRSLKTHTFGKSRSRYHFYQLPCNIEEAAKRISHVYENNKTKAQSWPGGKRSHPKIFDKKVG